MHVVIFSPLQFLYIPLLAEREVCVLVMALQPRVPGPTLSQVDPEKVQLRKRHCVFLVSLCVSIIGLSGYFHLFGCGEWATTEKCKAWS